MLCTNCGKDVPFIGKLCPYCKTDKSYDQETTSRSMILGVAFSVVCGFLGWAITNDVGVTILSVIGGMVTGVALGVFLPTTNSKDRLPPTVRITPVDDHADRLKRLKTLFDDGYITVAEYQERRSEILKET